MVKNMVDVIFGGLSYWLFGFGLSFGTDPGSNGFVGVGYFLTDAEHQDMGNLFARFFFQLSFATTATTIVSGMSVGPCSHCFVFVCLHIWRGRTVPVHAVFKQIRHEYDEVFTLLWANTVLIMPFSDKYFHWKNTIVLEMSPYCERIQYAPCSKVCVFESMPILTAPFLKRVSVNAWLQLIRFAPFSFKYGAVWTWPWCQMFAMTFRTSHLSKPEILFLIPCTVSLWRFIRLFTGGKKWNRTPKSSIRF